MIDLVFIGADDSELFQKTGNFLPSLLIWRGSFGGEEMKTKELGHTDLFMFWTWTVATNKKSFLSGGF